jgi:hypothetical protein
MAIFAVLRLGYSEWKVNPNSVPAGENYSEKIIQSALNCDFGGLAGKICD